VPFTKIQPFTFLSIRGGSNGSSSSSNNNNSSSSSSNRIISSRDTNSNIETNGKQYAKIGLIDLSLSFQDLKDATTESTTTATSRNEKVTDKPPPLTTTTKVLRTTHGNKDKDDGVMQSLLENWIQSRNFYSSQQNAKTGTTTTNTNTHVFRQNNDFGTIYAIPLSSTSTSTSSITNSFHEYTIPFNQHQQEEERNKRTIGSIVETIGCLVDTIIILYDVQCPFRQRVIIRLLKGVQRQEQKERQKQQQHSIDNNNENDDGNKGWNNRNIINMIFLAQGKQAELELNAIRDILLKENEIPNIDAMQIIPIHENNDISSSSSIIQDQLTVSFFKMYSKQKKRSNLLSITSFYKLIHSVYSKLLSGMSSDIPKNVVETIGAVEFIENNHGMTNLVEEEEDNIDSVNDVDDEEEEVLLDDDGSHDDSLNDNDVVDDERMNQEIKYDNNEKEDFEEEKYEEEEMLDHAKKTTISLSSEYDDEEVINLDEDETFAVVNDVDNEEEESISDNCETTTTIATSQTPSTNSKTQEKGDEQTENNKASTETTLSSTEQQQIIDDLVTKSNEVIQHAENLMDELEMKQDEVLLDIETKMPILQFGSETSKILKQIINLFDNKKLSKRIKDKLDTNFVNGTYAQVY
jgi:hypothetical protein